MIELQNMPAFVTGAGSGLGAAIARRLVAAGARVVLADIAEAVHFLLMMSPESVVSEIMVLPREETSWP